MQLLIGMSIKRYLAPRGTAGFARSFVSGKRRLPCPPPMMTESTLLVLTDWRPVCVITDPLLLDSELFVPSYSGIFRRSASGFVQKSRSRFSGELSRSNYVYSPLPMEFIISRMEYQLYLKSLDKRERIWQRSF